MLYTATSLQWLSAHLNLVQAAARSGIASTMHLLGYLFSARNELPKPPKAQIIAQNERWQNALRLNFILRLNTMICLSVQTSAERQAYL